MSTQPVPIALLSNHGPVLGGGELSLVELASRLDRSRWAATVATPSEGEVAARCREAGLRTAVIPLPSLRRPTWQAWRSLAALRRLRRETGARLLHANGSRAMLFAALAGIPRACPVVWHVRVADPEPLLDRLLARCATVIVVNSEAVGRRFARITHANVRLVYNGVDLSRFGPRGHPGEGGQSREAREARAAWEIPAEAPLIVSVGRFVAYKGYRDLIEAAALTQREVPDAQWVLAGDGELRPSLEAQAAERGLEKHVHFLGWRDDVPELLAHADLFVLPSHGEHFGRVVIEAMAAAKPVVATASGGVPEIVEDGVTGALVPPADPGALSRAMTSLIRDRATAGRMGRAGRRRVEERFGLERHVREMDAVFADCIGEARHGCNLCGGTDWRTLEQVHGTRVVRCPCGLVFVTPQPSLADLEPRYGEAYYTPWDRQERLRRMIWRRRLAAVRAAVPTPGRLLDVGCGTGTFLRLAQRDGWDVTGTECSPYAGRTARADGLAVYDGEVWDAKLPAQSFDVITSWHVIEHVGDPRRVLEECARLLRPGGRLFLATPNLHDRFFRFAYALARGRRPPLFEPDGREPHLYFFDAESLRRLAAAAGLQVVRVGFDRGAAAVRSKRLIEEVARLWFLATGIHWGMGLELHARKPPVGGAQP